MIRFATDENIDRRLIAGLMRRVPRIDLGRLQDAGLSGANDPTVLEWAASEGRILLSHDLATMSQAAYNRVALGLTMPGVFLIRDTLPLAVVLDDLAIVAEFSLDEEWKDRVHYLPL